MIISSVSQGLLWGILGLGIYLTFRILNFPDMTTEGSFPLGGAVAVTLMNHGTHPLLATLTGMLAGCLAGLVTGLLYTKGKIPTLLAGILVMTSCNSVMLMVMKRANLGLLNIKPLQALLPFADSTNLLVIGLLAVVIVISALIFFFTHVLVRLISPLVITEIWQRALESILTAWKLWDLPFQMV